MYILLTNNNFMKKIFFILLSILFSQQIFSQNLFDEVFEGCNTDKFTVESDSISLQPKNAILGILRNSFDKETVKIIDGLLVLQILVDLEGNSCLLSVQNETNKKTEQLNLKNIIDNNLKWEIPKEKKSAIIAIQFSEIVEAKRVGLSSEKGFHELE